MISYIRGMFKSLTVSSGYYLLLAVFALVGYWPVSCMVYSMPYDILDATLPWRYFISECLRSGTLPLWNPYQALGYPIYADPQSGAWYPVVWLLSYCCGYNIYVMHAEFMLHILLAGIGMYTLALFLGMGRRVCILMASSYMFCGFFVGSTQILNMTISAAWIPFTFLYLLRLLQGGGTKDSLKLSLVLFLFLTGGYVGIGLVLLYVLLTISVFHLVPDIVSKNYGIFFRKIKYLALSLVCFLALSAATLTSLFTANGLFTRSSQGLTLADALPTAFTPQSFISFALPFTAVKDMDFFDTDLSMSNGYFGLIVFALFMLWIFRKGKARIEWLFFVIGICCLLASMGKYTPVRAWLFEHIPLMNMSRFPSIFRVYTILCFILLAGYLLNRTSRDEQSVHWFKRILVALVVILSGIFYFSLLRSSGEAHAFLHQTDFFTALYSISFYESLVTGSFVQLVLLSTLLLALTLRKPTGAKFQRYIILFALTEILTVIQFNIPFTTASNIRTSVVDKNRDNFPSGFPVPPQKLLAEISSSGKNNFPFWRNLSIFYKEPGYDFYNTFCLNNYEKIYESPQFSRVLQHSIISLTDKVLPYSPPLTDSVFHDFITTEEKVYKSMLTDGALKKSPGDTAVITLFDPGHIRAEVTTLHPQVITLYQNNFPGWKVFVNGEEAPFFVSDYAFISVKIPQGGKYIVEYKYFNPLVVAGAIVSGITLCIIAFILLRRNRLSQTVI